MVSIAEEVRSRQQDFVDRDRARLAERSRRTYAATSEIGELPEVVNPDRKRLCKYDLLLFLQTYFRGSTGISPFEAGHLKAIARIERAILKQGLRQRNAERLR